ncbi:MAG: LemA family protein [SAR324 cluster bacterium]|nr:LemA family protein [SAR324 cluster bacterium]
MWKRRAPVDETQERATRVQEMASRLFAQEMKPKKTASQIRTRRQFMVFCVFFVILLSISVLYRINKFIDMREQVLAAKGGVEVSLRKRSNLFHNIANAALNQAKLEYELVKHVADSRAKQEEIQKTEVSEEKPSEPEWWRDSFPEELERMGLDSKLVEELKSALNSGGVLPDLNALVEQYPKVKFSFVYSKLIKNLILLENEIMLKQDHLHEATKAYNTQISQFPWYFLAKTAGFRRFSYFSVKGPAHDPPMMKSNMYRRLLPPEVLPQSNQGLKP